MPFLATIDGKEVTINDDQIKPSGDGYGLITPNSIPEGFVKQSVMDATIGQRIAQEKTKLQDTLKADPEFHKTVLGSYNIELDESGKPKGIKTDADVARKIQEATSATKQEYENKVSMLKSRAIQGEVSAALSQAGFKGPKEISSTIASKFDLDENGNVALKDAQGFVINPNGNGERNYKAPSDYVNELKGSDDWKNLFADPRPAGSGFGGSNNGNGSTQTIKRENFDKLSQPERMKLVKSGVKIE